MVMVERTEKILQHRSGTSAGSSGSRLTERNANSTHIRGLAQSNIRLVLTTKPLEIVLFGS